MLYVKPTISTRLYYICFRTDCLKSFVFSRQFLKTTQVKYASVCYIGLYVRGCNIPLLLAILKVSTRCRILLSLRYASRFLTGTIILSFYRPLFGDVFSVPGSSWIRQTSRRRLVSSTYELENPHLQSDLSLLVYHSTLNNVQ